MNILHRVCYCKLSTTYDEKMKSMLEVMDSKLTQYIVHYVSETVISESAIEKIDILLKFGFDEETNQKFYKIYFQKKI